MGILTRTQITFMLAAPLACFAASPKATVVATAGADANSIRPSVTAFQQMMGALNPPGPPADATGRREINWDAVPAQFAAPNNLPPDFFNKNSVRGAVFSSESSGWTGFQVSANEADGPVRFGTIQPAYPSLFQFFSAEKLFTSIGSTDYLVDFFVPGTQVRGKVKGFGAVFTNVAIPFTSSIELLTAEGISLGVYYVPPAPKGMSFVGVMFNSRIVARVRVVQGTVQLGESDRPAEGANVVVVDDFIYSEPTSDCVVNP